MKKNEMKMLIEGLKLGNPSLTKEQLKEKVLEYSKSKKAEVLNEKVKIMDAKNKNFILLFRATDENGDQGIALNINDREPTLVLSVDKVKQLVTMFKNLNVY